MMRSLFSGVAGLKTHQTRMDVIGNNIANVNTTAYKSQSMVFNDLLYQTSQAASGANATTGRGGTNARQIGLGAKTGGISTTITTQGSAQSTNNPWDLMIEGDSFFIVSDGSQNFFTRDGSFTIDGAGNLVMTSTGYTLMGWQVDPETGEVRSDVVSALRVMHPDNMTAPPEATSLGYIRGILDSTDTDLNSTRGVVRTLKFYDALGFEYTALFSIHATNNEDQFRVQLDDIKDSTGMSLVTKYGLTDIYQVAKFGGTTPNTETSYAMKDSNAHYDYNTNIFSIDQTMEEILEGFSNNPLLAAAKLTITKIGDDAPPEDKEYEAESEVTVQAELTLTPAQLRNSPYNINYVDGKYYGGKGVYQGKEIVDTLSTDTDVAANQITWTDALEALGLEDLELENVVVTPLDDGSGTITIKFEDAKSCTLKSTATYNTSSGLFNTSWENTKENEKAILEQVYHMPDDESKTYSIEFVAPDGSAQITMSETVNGNLLVFDHDSGKFSYVGKQNSDTATLEFALSAVSLSGQTIDLSQFGNIDIDFSSVSHLGNGGRSTLEMTNGSKEDSTIGAGRRTGDLIGIEVAQDGKIKATYDNGMTKLLGQIAVAEFANPSGLAKAGNNLYSTTLNSGEFDGVGTDVTANGGTITSGVLEMSNVDLSSEFTTMITTQRGFQANSRIITVSDSLLEELTNMKR